MVQRSIETLRDRRTPTTTGNSVKLFTVQAWKNGFQPFTQTTHFRDNVNPPRKLGLTTMPTVHW